MRDHLANPRGGRQSLRPVIDSVGRILTEGRRVTPIGIAVSISLPFALFFGLLVWVLGRDGIVQITSAWGESADANRELATQVAEGHKKLETAITGLRADLAAYDGRTKKTQEDLTATRAQLAMVCDLATELNKGRPREDWCGPPGKGTRFFPPSLGALTPYLLTHAPYVPQ